MTLTIEQRRLVAGLSRNAAWPVLLNLITATRMAPAMAQLRKASGRDEVYEAALTYRTLEAVREDLERIPREIAKDLDEEGDEIYGTTIR